MTEAGSSELVRRAPRAIGGVQIAGIAAVAVVVAAAAFFLLRPGGGSTPTSPATVSQAEQPAPPQPSGHTVPQTAAPQTAAPQAAAPTSKPQAPPAPAPQTSALRLELSAIRPVWIRVTVDGRRAIEREVPPGFRTTIDADRAVAIRAGDAGALHVGVNGAAAAPLGRTGQVATRIFQAPAGR